MVRSTAVRNTAVRSSLRRAAALAATGTLAVLATAGPALASSSAPAPATGVVTVAGAAQTQRLAPQAFMPQDNTPQTTPQDGTPPCEHHHGLVTGLLEGVGILLSKLLGVLL